MAHSPRGKCGLRSNAMALIASGLWFNGTSSIGSALTRGRLVSAARNVTEVQGRPGGERRPCLSRPFCCRCARRLVCLLRVVVLLQVSEIGADKPAPGSGGKAAGKGERATRNSKSGHTSLHKTPGLVS